jgi:hypothetical protein
MTQLTTRTTRPAASEAQATRGACRSPLQRLADASAPVAQLRSLQSLASGGVVQRKDWYAYGDGGSTPHVHCYSGGDCHVQIFDRGRVRRYNIVQDGKRHAQAADALAAAAGNPALLAVITTQLQGY